MTVRPPSIGALTGLASEAAILRDFSHDPVTKVQIGVSAAQAALARAQVAELLKAKPSGLISFGLAGALDPELVAGSLVIPDQICDQQGHRHFCDREWATALRTAAARRGQSVVNGKILGSDTVIRRRLEKEIAFKEFKALAVDMESHFLAAAADQNDIPFIVVRAIADTASDDLPKAALAPLTATGKPRIDLVLLELIKRPWELPALARLANQSARAHNCLRGLQPLSAALFRSL
ncbi:MAG: hypothetical protein AAF530_13435 [Pseudomonadota bacterium]